MQPNDPDAVAARDAAYRYLEHERATHHPYTPDDRTLAARDDLAAEASSYNTVAVLPADIGRIHLDREPSGGVVATVPTREPGGHPGALVIRLRRAAGAGWQVHRVERLRRDLGDPPAETLADRMRRVERERHQAAVRDRHLTSPSPGTSSAQSRLR